MPESDIEKAELLPKKDRRLGRHILHDSRSRAFAFGATIDTTTWNTAKVKVFDPRPEPNQCHSECTACAQCMLFNTRGNRNQGHILNMNDAHKIYGLATTLDPFPGEWTEAGGWADTGSDGLSAAKASVSLGYGGAYNFLFQGADETVQAIQQGHAVAIGTKWYNDMFHPRTDGFIEPTGELAGGHEYIARTYIEPLDAIGLRCWWGDGFKNVLIKREHLNDLIMDNGDQHVQAVAPA